MVVGFSSSVRKRSVCFELVFGMLGYVKGVVP